MNDDVENGTLGPQTAWLDIYNVRKVFIAWHLFDQIFDYFHNNKNANVTLDE